MIYTEINISTKYCQKRNDRLIRTKKGKFKTSTRPN